MLPIALHGLPVMTEPILHHVSCPGADGGHRLAWWQWGAPQASRAVLCMHGLTRVGRDFDVLAQALVARAEAQGHALRVVCPDVVGRGESDWLSEPMGYQYPTYVADALTLLSTLHAQAPVASFDWVGTSMGGVIGLSVAGMPGLPLAAPLRRLVLNDVGPAIEWQAIERIRDYVGKAPTFESVEAGAAYLRTLSAGFGPFTDAAWLALSRPLLRPLPDGRWRLHYDPAIATPMAGLTPEAVAQGEAALWNLYDQIKADTLLLRGAESDLLSRATAQAMGQRGPRARLIEFAGIGHAPMLMADDQVRAVLDFLLPDPAAAAAPRA